MEQLQNTSGHYGGGASILSRAVTKLAAYPWCIGILAVAALTSAYLVVFQNLPEQSLRLWLWM